MNTELERVTRAAKKVDQDRSELHAAIRSAREAGESIRSIAAASGLSVGNIHAITRSTT